MHAVYLQLRPLDPVRRRAKLLELAPQFATSQALATVCRRMTEGRLWHADHVRAVCVGGGGGGLDTFQTLCVPCHLEKTRVDRRLAKGLCGRGKVAVPRIEEGMEDLCFRCGVFRSSDPLKLALHENQCQVRRPRRGPAGVKVAAPDHPQACDDAVFKN